MSRRQKDPLRALSTAERTELTRLSRSRSAPAACVARATALLAVAAGQSYLAAARRAGRRDGDTVAAWVARFNREGLAAVRPAHGGVRVQPAARGTNAVLHGWLKQALAAIVAALPAAAEPGDPAATRALWEAWQQGLTVRFTLPERLPPLRLLMVWDSLAGHKTPEMVLWLCRHGIMPLYTPLGGSWLNM